MSNHQALNDTTRAASFTPCHLQESDPRLTRGRSSQALKHLSTFDVFNSDQRSNATLHLGNVDYNASEQDIYNAVAPTFQYASVDNVIIPRVQGLSMYAFIEISWPQAPVNVADICIARNDGTIAVNGRLLYFRESHNKGGHQ
jgi:hypothetical protein